MLPFLIFNRALMCLNLVLAFNALAFEQFLVGLRYVIFGTWFSHPYLPTFVRCLWTA